MRAFQKKIHSLSNSSAFLSFSANKVGNGDILCEMRFHVPNNELEIYQEEREAAKAEERKKRKADAVAAGGEEEKKGDDAEESEAES